jgi:hypothetical protein
VGCGGASSTVNPLTPTRVIAFGDAFSTVDSVTPTSGYSTYTVDTSETNANVASRIASIYGFTMKHYTASPSVIHASGSAYSYAAGTATSSQTKDQVQLYLSNGNSPGASDLFIITSGTRDIYTASQPAKDTSAIATAATKLTEAVQLLTNAGAKYILVMQPINVARTPPFLAATSNAIRPAGAYAAYNSNAQELSYDTGTACQSFSCLLSTKLNSAYPATSSHQPVLLADLMSYFNLITGSTNTGSANTFSSYGVANPDMVVCTAAVPGCTTGSVTTGTNQYTSTTWDYATSIFAYGYYTTPFANRLMADYIYNYNFYRAGWR